MSALVQMLNSSHCGNPQALRQKAWEVQNGKSQVVLQDLADSPGFHR